MIIFFSHGLTICTSPEKSDC